MSAILALLRHAIRANIPRYHGLRWTFYHVVGIITMVAIIWRRQASQASRHTALSERCLSMLLNYRPVGLPRMAGTRLAVVTGETHGEYGREWRHRRSLYRYHATAALLVTAAALVVNYRDVTWFVLRRCILSLASREYGIIMLVVSGVVVTALQLAAGSRLVTRRLVCCRSLLIRHGGYYVEDDTVTERYW